MKNYTHFTEQYNRDSNNKIRIFEYTSRKTQLLFLRPNTNAPNNYFNLNLTTYFGLFNIINGRFLTDNKKQFPAIYYGSTGYEDIYHNNIVETSTLIIKWWESERHKYNKI